MKYALECIERMYLNLYVPGLQAPEMAAPSGVPVNLRWACQSLINKLDAFVESNLFRLPKT